MFRIYLVILILHLGLIFQGCGALQYFDGTSEEIKRLEMTNQEISSEMEKFKIENAHFKEQINILSEENNAIRDENANKMVKMSDEKKLLQSQLNTLKEENQKISKENQTLYKNIADLRLKYQTLPSKKLPPAPYKLAEPGKDIGKLKIKALSGDGDLNSAKKIAKKLRDMGYTIKLIDRSPRSNFSQNTVFFAPKFQNEAEQLASRLGDNTISKPLSWSSMFDLIVVTGRNPSGWLTEKK